MEFETRIIKTGNSFAFALPKAFINTKVFSIKKKYKISIEEVKSEQNLDNSEEDYSHIINL